jgi:hypothetical protein
MGYFEMTAKIRLFSGIILNDLKILKILNKSSKSLSQNTSAF